MKCTQCGCTDLVKTCSPFVLANSTTPIECFVCKECGYYEFFLAGKSAKATAPDKVKNDMEDLRHLQINAEESKPQPKD